MLLITQNFLVTCFDLSPPWLSWVGPLASGWVFQNATFDQGHAHPEGSRLVDPEEEFLPPSLVAWPASPPLSFPMATPIEKASYSYLAAAGQSEDMSERMSKAMLERIAENMLERMSKDMSARTSEDCWQSVCEVENNRTHFRKWIICLASPDSIRMT